MPKETPLGKLALITHDVTFPPGLVMVGAIIVAVLFVNVLFSGSYWNWPGASSLIVMTRIVEVEPPELLA